MLSRISNQPKIIEVLQQYGKPSGEIKDIFWKLMASGAGEYVAQLVIENPESLSKYLRMKANGVSDMEIAFKFTEILGGSWSVATTLHNTTYAENVRRKVKINQCRP